VGTDGSILTGNFSLSSNFIGVLGVKVEGPVLVVWSVGAKDTCEVGRVGLGFPSGEIVGVGKSPAGCLLVWGVFWPFLFGLSGLVCVLWLWLLSWFWVLCPPLPGGGSLLLVFLSSFLGGMMRLMRF
jgi:hypothetical protein